MKKRDTVNLGNRRWRGIWISKNDMVEFLRCPYRVYLSYTTGIPIGEMKDAQAIGAILERGIRFESSVISEGQFKEVRSGEAVEPLLSQNFMLRVPRLFRNHELGIQGIPDVIDTRRGKLYSIEIKMHKEVTECDRLELAFYWMLLSPLRKGNPKPKGYVLLGSGETVEVSLTRDHLFEVDWLIEEIREVKRNGVQPVLSQECKLCTLMENCRREVSEKGGLSLIHGIAYVREQQLEWLGIENISALARANALQLHEGWLSRFGISPGLNEIKKMQLHAFSLIARKPVFFGDLDSFGFAEEPSVILDLEYDPASYIWLVGLCVKDDGAEEYHQYFAERYTMVEERRILTFMIEVIERMKRYVLVTFGASADMPQLRKAWNRQGLPPNLWSSLEENHMDLYTFILRNFRFPLASYSLKDIESFLGFQRKNERIDGLLALAMYRQYLRQKNDRKRAALKEELLNYNKEDLQATAFITDRLRDLPKECVGGGPI